MEIGSQALLCFPSIPHAVIAHSAFHAELSLLSSRYYFRTITGLTNLSSRKTRTLTQLCIHRIAPAEIPRILVETSRGFSRISLPRRAFIRRHVIAYVSLPADVPAV